MESLLDEIIGHSFHSAACKCKRCRKKHGGKVSIESSWIDEELTSSPLNAAIKFNRENAQRIGWLSYYHLIVEKILGLNYSPDEASFAQDVADWQKKAGLKDADGKVGPETWEEMKGILGILNIPSNAPYPLVNKLMPKQGNGFLCTKLARNRYGLSETIVALQKIAESWRRIYPTGPRIQIGDISRAGGGHFPPHVSHRIGLDIDIRPIRKDKRETSVTISESNYDREGTRKLISEIINNPILQVKVIFFDDQELIRFFPNRLVQKESNSNHVNHMHVRFCLPSAPKYSEMNRVFSLYRCG
jgi:hypothetical protein